MNKMIANVLVASTVLTRMNTVSNADGARKKKASAVVATVLIALLLPGSAWAQDPVEKEAASPLLGWIGVFTMAFGGVMMLPISEGQNLSVNGRSYCYDDGPYAISLNSGRCSTMKPMIKAGLITVGVGAVITYLGVRKVEVSTVIDNDTIGASASIKWGGKR